MLRVDDEVTAFFLNRAIGAFGSAVESDIAANTRNAKNQAEAQQMAVSIMMKWLGVEPGKTPGLFKDPAKHSMKF